MVGADTDDSEKEGESLRPSDENVVPMFDDDVDAWMERALLEDPLGGRGGVDRGVREEEGGGGEDEEEELNPPGEERAKCARTTEMLMAWSSGVTAGRMRLGERKRLVERTAEPRWRKASESWRR